VCPTTQSPTSPSDENANARQRVDPKHHHDENITRYIEELGPKSPRIAASPIRNTRCTIEWGLTADEGTDKTPVPTDLSQTADDADMSWSSMPRLAVC
jgi:hypothetical protein